MVSTIIAKFCPTCPRGSVRLSGFFAFTPAMGKLVREILAELATPPILFFPTWGAVADGSRPFHVYCDACIDRFGAAHGQEQEDGSMKPIPYISRTTLDSERHWTPIDLEADKHRLGAQTPPRLPLGNPVPHVLRLQGTRKHRQSGTHTPESRGVSSSSPRPTTHSSTAKEANGNGNADFLSRLPEPGTEHDRSGSTSLNPVEESGKYLLRACRLNTPSSPIPGVGLGGLVPSTESAVLGGIPFTSADFCVFHTQGPRMRIEGLSSSRSFVARVSGSVATDDCRHGRGRAFSAADNDLASVLAVPT